MVVDPGSAMSDTKRKHILISKGMHLLLTRTSDNLFNSKTIMLLNWNQDVQHTLAFLVVDLPSNHLHIYSVSFF
ncbi:hypothetical protein HanPSC8_Chr11g0485021 [Helianthus annuus]|nr:hypothetical protein HanPSC8_Chr11g0485021 [Helianthus annuus]